MDLTKCVDTHGSLQRHRKLQERKQRQKSTFLPLAPSQPMVQHLFCEGWWLNRSGVKCSMVTHTRFYDDQAQ